ncbi:MAG: hypothetical protein WCH43_16535, partial [Verrucomicrobiota bacterium]
MSQVQQVRKAPPRRSIWVKLMAGKFLLVSILIHFFFLAGATIWVVQKFYTTPKLQFKGGEKGQNQNMRAMEHKVSIAKKSTMSSAPIQAHRVTTTSLSKVNLPETPAMPSVSEVSPVTMGGASGGIPGLDKGKMSAAGSGLGGGGAGFTMFGFRQPPKTGTLMGTLYDTKQTQGRKSSDMNGEKFKDLVKEFAANGYKPQKMGKFYKAPHKIFATQLFIPVIDANDGPKAFQVENTVKSPLWVVFYTARISPPKTGVYRFVGWGDDVLVVRMGGGSLGDPKMVLEWDSHTESKTGFTPENKYHYEYGLNMVIDGKPNNNSWARANGHG